MPGDEAFFCSGKSLKSYMSVLTTACSNSTVVCVCVRILRVVVGTSDLW